MECGPEVGSVEASASLPVGFDDASKRRLRAALDDAGFTTDEEYFGTVHAVRGDLDLRVTDGDGATVDAWLRFDIRDKEFEDTPSGSDAAYAYIAAEARRVQPAANQTFALVVAALGLAPQPAPQVGGTYGIC